MIKAVLFDLDGTLIDTAPDMANALNVLLEQEGLEPLSFELIRPYVSKGGLALTQLGFSKHVEEAGIEPLRLRFLDHYFNNIAIHSQLFTGFDQVLTHLEHHKIPWGIVTNKPGWLTTPLLAQMNLASRSSVTISGDTTAQRKPHPLPLQTAASIINIECKDCLYVGDDLRDIEAGNAASMQTMIAAYGYIYDHLDLSTWNAQHIIQKPTELLNIL